MRAHEGRYERRALFATTVTCAALVGGACGATTVSDGGVTPLGVTRGNDEDFTVHMPRASLGFALADVMPDVSADALPHGPPGWPWRYGSVEFKSFKCHYDESLPAVDPNDPNKPPILLRFGTYGIKADTKTDQYNEEWFKAPEHATDIQWTYRLCDDDEFVECQAQEFGHVDPFPSIEHGAPGKRCQFLDTRSIKDELRISAQVGPEGDRKDADSLNVAVETFLKNQDGKGIVVQDVTIIAPTDAIAAIEEKYPDVTPQKMRWKWCANEGDGDDNWCACNTIMRFGWTGSAAEPAPSAAVDPDFIKFVYADMRDMDKMLKCSSHKLGEILPWPDREENSRICQCLDPTVMDKVDDAFAEKFGGPVDFLDAIPSSSTSVPTAPTPTAQLGKATTPSRSASAHATTYMVTLMTISAAALAFVVVRRIKSRHMEEYEPLLETTI